MHITRLSGALLAAFILLPGCSGSSPAPTPAGATSSSSLLPQTPAPIALYVGAIKPHAEKLRNLAEHLAGCVAPEGFECSPNLDAAVKEVAALTDDVDAAQHIGRAPDEAKEAFDALTIAAIQVTIADEARSTDFAGVVLAVQGVVDALQKWRPFGV